MRFYKAMAVSHYCKGRNDSRTAETKFLRADVYCIESVTKIYQLHEKSKACNRSSSLQNRLQRSCHAYIFRHNTE